MKNVPLTSAVFLLLLALSAPTADAQTCFDFDLFCDGLELSASGGVVTGFWRNTDCAGTDVFVSGPIMLGPLGLGAYVRCDCTTDPCPLNLGWGFFIDAPLDGTLEAYQAPCDGGPWTFFAEIAYTVVIGPCPFAPGVDRPGPDASSMASGVRVE